MSCILVQLVCPDQHGRCIVRRLRNQCSMRTCVGIVIQSCLFVVPSRSTLWKECSTCFINFSPDWTCPAALITYADIGGVGANIVEVDLPVGERGS